MRHLFHPRTDVSIPCLSREQLVPVAVLYTEDFPLRHQFHPRADVSMPCLSRERLGPAAVPYGEDFPLRPHSSTVTEYLLFIWVMGKHIYHVEGPMIRAIPLLTKDTTLQHSTKRPTDESINEVPLVYTHAERTYTHVKDLVAYVRVRWTMETPK